MNSILMSIQPKWCELIASGKKTIEVRKTAPKEVPFRAFIYCTKGGDKLYLDYEGQFKYSGGYHYNENNSADNYNDQLVNGKVIGEFVCDKVTKYEDIDLSHFEFAREDNGVDKYPIEENSCLTLKQMHGYGKGKDLYFLHITALKIYDKPRELGEFRTRWLKNDCEKCVYNFTLCIYLGKKIKEVSKCHAKITRAPQSWQYVETPDWAEEDKI